MGEHGTGVMGNVVNQYSASATLGAVTAKFGSGETEFVPQGPGESLLLHGIDAALLAVHVDGDEAVTGVAVLSKEIGGPKEVAG
jgi:hypothetical protein